MSRPRDTSPKSTMSRVACLRRQDPGRTQTSMAQELGCSKEWVRTLLIRLGLPTRAPTAPRLCPTCDAPIRARGRKYCSQPCRPQQAHQTLECPRCHSTFTRRAGTVPPGRVQPPYCSRACRGADLGDRYGFGSSQHPSGHPTTTRPHRRTSYQHTARLRRAAATARRCREGPGHPRCTPAQHLQTSIDRLEAQALTSARTTWDPCTVIRAYLLPDHSILALTIPQDIADITCWTVRRNNPQHPSLLTLLASRPPPAPPAPGQRPRTPTHQPTGPDNHDQLN